MSYNQTSLANLLNEHGMELEVLQGVSGVTIGYRISKTFRNRTKAGEWVARILQLEKEEKARR